MHRLHELARSRTILSFLVALCAGSAHADISPPAVTGAMYDGAQNDVCANSRRVYVAAGRNVAVLDAVTGERLGLDPYSPYAYAVQAIEYDGVTGTLLVATTRELSLTRHDGTHLVWQAPAGESFPTFQDIKVLPGAEKVVAVAGRRLAVFDTSGASIFRISDVLCPIADVGALRRVHVSDVDGDLRAFLVVGLVGSGPPRKTALVFADLDREHGYAAPHFEAADWRAHVAYNDDYAGARAVEVVADLYGEQDVAFVADNYGGLSVLDVSQPSQPVLLAHLDPTGSCGSSGGVYNLLAERARDRLHVAGGNRLYTLRLSDLAILGCCDVGFVDAGRRDMALVRRRNGARVLWTTTPHAVPWSLNGIDVTNDAPQVVRQRWWIASSDGAVAAPQWNSIYLPTFGGVVRYDVSHEWSLQPIESSYRPTGGPLTEHIEIAYPNPADTSHALLLTATGSGGVQVWPVSAAAPDPGAPQIFSARPPSWSALDGVYQNDVEPYARAGHTFALTDLANNTTGELALQAFDVATGAVRSVVLPAGTLFPNATDVAVAGPWALVAARGGLFSVRLDALPGPLQLGSARVIDLDLDGAGDNVAAIAATPSGNRVFLATDAPGRVASFTLDLATGALSAPISVLSGSEYPGCVGRMRFFAPTQRLYVASRSSTLVEVFVGADGSLQLLSRWRDDGAASDLQDAQIYDFGHGPRVLAVKNTEGFVLLNPVDGL